MTIFVLFYCRCLSLGRLQQGSCDVTWDEIWH